MIGQVDTPERHNMFRAYSDLQLQPGNYTFSLEGGIHTPSPRSDTRASNSMHSTPFSFYSDNSFSLYKTPPKRTSTPQTITTPSPIKRVIQMNRHPMETPPPVWPKPILTNLDPNSPEKCQQTVNYSLRHRFNEHQLHNFAELMPMTQVISSPVVSGSNFDRGYSNICLTPNGSMRKPAGIEEFIYTGGVPFQKTPEKRCSYALNNAQLTISGKRGHEEMNFACLDIDSQPLSPQAMELAKAGVVKRLQF